MTVKEFALRQLHWMVQNDPWVQEIFLAGGESLDQLAERILAISRFDNFELLNRAQVEYYEKILGLPQDDNKSLDDRRAAIQAAWQAAQKPSLATVTRSSRRVPKALPWWAASIRPFPRSAAPARRSNSAACNRPATMRESTSCAACNNALSRTRRCNKGECTS